MKILKGNKGHIDFESPIELNELQKERLINFLNTLFYHVKFEEVKEFRDKRLGQANFIMDWEDEDYELLLKIDESNEEVSRKLGRTWMGIEMKRLYFIPQMMEYASKKGIDIYTIDPKELVKEFLREHGEKIIKRKEMKKKERIKQNEEEKEYFRLKEEIPKDEKLVGVPGFSITPEKIEEKKKRFKELGDKFEK